MVAFFTSPRLAIAVLLEFIAARLRDLRSKHNLTQEQMASLLGTDVKWYQRIEWSKKDVRASTIERLAAVFGVSPMEFMAAQLPETRVQPIAKAPHRPKTGGARKRPVKS